MRSARRAALLVAVVSAVTALTTAACSSSTSPRPGSATSPLAPRLSGSPPSDSPPSDSTTSATTAASSTRRTTSAAERALAGMSERARVGQLLMVDCPTSGMTTTTRAALRDDLAGSVILDGTSTAGLARVTYVVGSVRAAGPGPVGLLVATDQEGGLVQRLQGPGFAVVPSAIAQGQLAPSALERRARLWGQQLRAAGVNLDLAPVLDTVPAGSAGSAGSADNPPIGDLDREYGHTPAAVAAHGLAYARGMAAVGVDVAVKHFPGLGRVTGNTDAVAGVTDSVTTRDDPYLAPFRSAVRAGAPFVMMSTAIYSRIDPGVPAAFSRPIVTGLLRDTLGFHGVVISDDLGASAQVSSYSPGQRAVDFVAAGGDIVLTVDASLAGPMADALLARARRDPRFKRQVDVAALRVVTAKQAQGLLG